MMFQMCPGPWYTCDNRVADSFIFISIVLAAIWAFFMLVDYINHRKTYHLTWSISFIAVWVVFHQVIFTDPGSYLGLPGATIAAISSLIPGGIAAGLVFAVFPDKKLMDRFSYGLLYSLFVLIMAFCIGFFKLENVIAAIGHETWVGTIFVVSSHVISTALIIGLPIYIFIKKDANWKVLLMSVGGLLLGAAGFALSLLLTEILTAEIVFTLFPYLLLFATICFALGIFLPEKWRFSIPGIEFEEK